MQIHCLFLTSDWWEGLIYQHQHQHQDQEWVIYQHQHQHQHQEWVIYQHQLLIPLWKTQHVVWW